MTRHTKVIQTWLVLCFGLGCAGAGGDSATGSEPVIGGPCEGCEAVYQGIPEVLTAAAHLAPPDEPGEPLRIVGNVLHADGSPAPGTIIYAYQTNAAGIYPHEERFRGQAAFRHGKLRGWVEADANGRYRFDTVRPGSYPDTGLPQHVHLHVIEPGRCTYYINDIMFTDDPGLTTIRRKQLLGRGGDGVVTPRRVGDDGWHVERDIVLGAGISDYPGHHE